MSPIKKSKNLLNFLNINLSNLVIYKNDESSFPKKSNIIYISPVIIRVTTNGIVSFPNQAIPCQITTPVISRNQLSKRMNGPLIVEEYDATCVVPPQWQAELNEIGNIVLTREGTL